MGMEGMKPTDASRQTYDYKVVGIKCFNIENAKNGNE